MKKYLRHIVVLLCALIVSNIGTAQEKNVQGGWMTFKGYYDTRDRSMITMSSLVNLPGHFQYFGFINLFTPLDPPNKLELSLYYTEQNLFYKPFEKIPLGPNIQAVSTSGNGNDLVRFGIQWCPSDTPVFEKFFKKINLWYIINFHLVQTNSLSTNGWQWQIEHAYQWEIFPKTLHHRVVISGFADNDLNFGGGTGNNNWVYEHQLGVRLIHWLYAVAQIRHEFFLPEKTGAGFGLEYQFHF